MGQHYTGSEFSAGRLKSGFKADILDLRRTGRVRRTP
jgi:hypothetical protein